MLSAAKHLVAGWGRRNVFPVTLAGCGAIMAVLAYVSWFDFQTFSISGMGLPGVAGEVYLISGILIAGTGAAVSRRQSTIPLACAAIFGAIAFAFSSDQVLTHWQAGTCPGFGTNSRPEYICRDYSDMIWYVNGSPTVALWAAAGLSAFVSLLAAWRLFARPAPTEPEMPTEIPEAWA